METVVVGENPNKDKNRKREKDELYSRLKKMVVVPFVAVGVIVLFWLIYLVANMYLGRPSASPAAFFWKLFADFNQIAYFSLNKNAYKLENGSSYSAVNLLLFRPIALIFKRDLNALEYKSDWGGVENARLLSSYRFWIAFLLYHAATIGATCVLSFRFVTKGNREGKCPLALFLISAPTLFVLIRGNLIFLSLTFTLIFLNWYDDEKAWKREIAVVALSVAGAVKLYPLFFCAFLLHDKKWFATVRMFVYFAILYVLPAYAFNGGFSAYLSNLLNFAGGNRMSRLAHMTNISLASMLYKIVYYPTQWLGLSLPVWLGTSCSVVGYIYLLLLAVAAVVTKNSLKRAILSLCAVALVPQVSYYYSMVYAAIPLIYYFKDFNSHSEVDHKKLFICAFFTISCVAFLFVPCSLTLIIMGTKVLIDVFKSGDFKEYMTHMFKKEKKEGGNL